MNLGRVGFVLDGGGFAGAYGVGFLKALIAKGIKPDFVQGASVGALTGAKFVSEDCDIVPLEKKWMMVQRLGASAFFNWRDIVTHWRSSSLFTNDRLSQLLVDDIDLKKLIDSPIHFQAVAVNEKNRRRIAFSNHDEMAATNPRILRDAILASISMVAFLPPVMINGEWHSDGQFPKLKKAIKDKCDTLFIIVNSPWGLPQTNTGELNWSRRIAFGMQMSVDSSFVKEIKYVVEHGYNLIENKPSPVFEDVRPLHKEVQRTVRQITSRISEVTSAKSMEDVENAFVPHRIVVLTPPNPISSLHVIGFHQVDSKTSYPGDITAAIEQCANCLNDEFWDQF